MQLNKPSKHVGPEPLPEQLYAARQLPVRRAVLWSGRVALLLAGVCILLGIFLMSLYRIPSGDPILRSASTILPLPAVRVNGRLIGYRAYSSMVDGWMELYQQQGAEGTADTHLLRDRILHRMIQDVLLEELVRELEVEVLPEDLASVESTFVEQYENEARYEEALYEQFRWTPEEFSKFVVEPLARLRALDSAVLASDVLQAGPFEVVVELHKDVRQNPDQFSELATQVSGSLSASDGGELGLRSISDYPESVRPVLLEAAEREITDVQTLPDRFVFYRVIEQATVRRERLVNAQEISVAKRDVYDILAERFANASITYYVQL